MKLIPSILILLGLQSVAFAADNPAVQWTDSLKVPEQNLPKLSSLPNRPGIVVGLRRIGETKGPSVGIYDLTDGNQSIWDLPAALFNTVPQPDHLSENFISLSYAQNAQQYLLARGGEIDLIQKSGSFSPLHLQMPGKLKPYQGMHDYALSSDGKFVAYSLYTRDQADKQPDGFGKLYMDLFYQRTEGSQPISLVSGLDIDNYIPAWSPDGTKLAYSTRDGGFGIVDLNGHKLSSVSSPIQQIGSPQPIMEIKWSPDGRKIGFLLKQKLYVSDESGVKPVNFGREDVQVNDFAWSPQGDQLTFHSNFEAGAQCVQNLAHKYETGGFPCLKMFFLYMANTDGTNLKRITNQAEYWPRDIFWTN